MIRGELIGLVLIPLFATLLAQGFWMVIHP
jgi:uncharacterized membrane protein